MNNYVKIKIVGKNPNIFIKRLLRENISYKDFKRLDYKSITIKIPYYTYLELKEKKSIYEIEVCKYYGVVKYLNFIKENLSFFVSFLISIIFLFFINNVIFEIDVVHNSAELRKLVKQELIKYDIDKFKLTPSFKKMSNVKNEIIKNNKNKIEWIEIERKGSKLIVKIAERKINNEKEDLKNRHIVARKSGIILKVEAERGVILKKINDYVNKGEIIISGDIIKDETVKGQVVAKGSVYAETWYKVNVEYPLYYEQTTYLDEVKNNIILKIFDKEYTLKKNYAKSYLENKKVLIKSKIFPFEISVEKQRKIKVTKERLSYEKATLKAQKLAEQKLKTKLSDDEYIISKKTLNFYKKDSKIVVDVFFKVCENITDYMNVDESLLNVPKEE